jgi:hypothetical protein
MTNFLALYRGDTVGSARMVAVSADPLLVADFAARLLERPPDPEEDPVLAGIEEGRRRALWTIMDEHGEEY